MEPVLSVEHVTRRFGSGATSVVAVHEVSLQIAVGEVVLIMGPSGSGKTTLLSMLGGLLKPSAGRIRVGGQELTRLSERELPAVRLHHIGFIFQDFNLLTSLSCLDNVALVGELAGVSRREARRHAGELLTQLGMEHRLHFLPEKISGGEKQRVAIARALANDPELILADEPTANLDSHHGRETMRLLRRLAKEDDRAILIVSHDQRIKEIADRVLWLEDGEFKEMVEMAVDPVCGMSVDKTSAPAQVDYAGRTYYFCAAGCRDDFLAEPARYLTGPKPMTATAA